MLTLLSSSSMLAKKSPSESKVAVAEASRALSALLANLVAHAVLLEILQVILIEVPSGHKEHPQEARVDRWHHLPQRVTEVNPEHGRGAGEGLVLRELLVGDQDELVEVDPSSGQPVGHGLVPLVGGHEQPDSGGVVQVGDQDREEHQGGDDHQERDASAGGALLSERLDDSPHRISSVEVPPVAKSERLTGLANWSLSVVAKGTSIPSFSFSG